MPARTSISLLTNSETAQLLGIKGNTLEIWRLKGSGPVFRKIGRSVRYLESDVLAWLDAQARVSTSQYQTRKEGAGANLPRSQRGSADQEPIIVPAARNFPLDGEILA